LAFGVTPTILLIAIIVLIIVILVVFYLRRLRERGKRIREDLFAMCGGEPRLLSKCTAIHKASRVPGIVALCHDRVIYRSLILDISGEIPLDRIERVEVKRSLQDRYSYKKVMAGARVLEIYFSEGSGGSENVQRFFLKTSEIAAWEQVLKE